MKISKDFTQKFNKIEYDFFNIDKETKTATVKLEFSEPKQIFDLGCLTKLPIFTDDFVAWLSYAYSIIPKKYKLKLDVYFDNMNGYTSDQLKEIFEKNIYLIFKSNLEEIKSKNFIAYLLIGIGIVFFTSMLLIKRLWDSTNIFHDIFIYIFDIATMVTFWEAVGILLIKDTEKRQHMKSIKDRFVGINFSLKNKKEE